MLYCDQFQETHIKQPQKYGVITNLLKTHILVHQLSDL